MSETANVSDIHQAALQRLRFERAMGVEFVPRVTMAPLAAVRQVAPQSVRIPEASAEPAKQPAGSANGTSEPLDRATRWQALEARALACTRCVLHKGRHHVVFGTGNREAKLVFVGEGPGQDEDLQGIPFVGRAGQLLNKIIAAMKLAREEVYICNVVKCRPPDNRTPLPDEVAACWPFLEEQLELVAPKAIVALGSPASKALLRTTQGIMSLRGKWFSYRGIPVMPTYHPAFLLRQYTEENRRAVWDDMKKVVEKIKEGQ